MSHAKPLRSLDSSPPVSRTSSTASVKRRNDTASLRTISAESVSRRNSSGPSRRGLKSGIRTAPPGSSLVSRRRKSRAFVPPLASPEDRALTFRPSPFVTSFPEPKSRPMSSLRPPKSLDLIYTPSARDPESPTRLGSGSTVFTPRATTSATISLESQTAGSASLDSANGGDARNQGKGGVPLSARGTRKEEFEYLEGIISNPRRANNRKMFDRLEGGEIRRECLRACNQLCVGLRLPCSASFRLDETDGPFSSSRRRKKDEVRKHKDASGVRAVFREYASEQRIDAIRTALVRVLRKAKIEE